jgi:hypothetical protein
MPFFSAHNLCPNCARGIRTPADRCEYCGHGLAPDATKNGLPTGVRRHRGGKILTLAVLSWMLLPVTCSALSIADYMLRIGIREAIPWLVGGAGALVCGQVSAVLATLFSYRDWFGLKAGRVERTGQVTTVSGGVMAGVSLLLYWCVMGAVVVSRF